MGLTALIGRVWNWRSLTGQIKDMAARALLLRLEQRGWVALPCAPAPFAQCWIAHGFPA